MIISRIVAGSTAVAFVTYALAQHTGVSLVPGTDTLNNGIGYSLGYEFTVGTSAINVTSLGYFDHGTLTENHEVGIYDMSGALLLTGTVAPGTSAVNYFAYTTSLSGSTALAANTSYEIMGVSGFVDPYSYLPTTFSTDPDISFVNAQITTGNNLAFGQFNDSYNRIFRPELHVRDGRPRTRERLYARHVGNRPCHSAADEAQGIGHRSEPFSTQQGCAAVGVDG